MIMTSSAFVSIQAESGIKIKPSDMNSFLTYILSKPSIATGESSFSLCLPSIADDGFLQFYAKFMTPNIGIIFAGIRKEDCIDFAEKAGKVAKQLEEIKFVAQITKSIHENYMQRSAINPTSIFFTLKNRIWSRFRDLYSKGL